MAHFHLYERCPARIVGTIGGFRQVLRVIIKRIRCQFEIVLIPEALRDRKGWLV